MVPRRVPHALIDGQVFDEDDDDDDSGGGCDDIYGDGCSYDGNGHVCGQVADEVLPRQHHRVLCVILGEHILSPVDLLPRWSILSCRR